MSYDEYLTVKQIKVMESDTVEDFLVKEVKFMDGDSARVDVDVMFIGPSLETTYYAQTWTMHNHEGRWIRPTLSSRKGQDEWEARRRAADSAAAAEERLDDDEW